MNYFIGVDVGTGSARAGVFDQQGHLLANNAKPIQMWNPSDGYAEQSSENIWSAICHCVRQSMEQAKIAPQDVKGIGFDATCSLVVVDNNGAPLTVSPSANPEQNVIVWMDHRATCETEEINSLKGFEVFDYVGGKISPEMQTPKLLWLRRHMPDTWKQAAHFFDLPDYLTHRATGSLSRSLCSTVCKWTYLGHQEGRGWQDSFFRAAGLGDLVDEGYKRIGTEILPIGKPIANGLCEQAAHDMGLAPGTAVGVSLIDAHAGGIGMIAVPTSPGEKPDFNKRLALIGGTSSCHMAISPQKRLIPGVWGPYYSAMVPGLWLNEGGQSATGALIDRIIFQNGPSAELREKAEAAGIGPYQFLNNRLTELAGDSPLHELTHSLHVCPYFHGNRSPRANPHLHGMISGLRLSCGLDDLALLYLATLQAIAYGTRHIIDEMNRTGYQIDTIIACGGGTKNSVFLQQHADITGCRIVLPEEQEAVLLGSAMLGAAASGTYASLEDAMQNMSRVGSIAELDTSSKIFHDKKYKVFHRLYEDQLSYETLMQ